VPGVGQKKADDLGPVFLDAIRTYCGSHGLTLDAGAG